MSASINFETGEITRHKDKQPVSVDHFDRLSAQAVTPDGKKVTCWHDLFVMLPWDAVGKLSAEHLLILAILYRLRDNDHKDVCKRVTTLEEVTGLKRLSLYRQLSKDPRDEEKHDGRRGALVGYASLRTEEIGKEPAKKPTKGAPVDDLLHDNRHPHVWYGSDGEPRWRIDLTRIDTATDRFVKVYYHWLWEDPATTGGDTWVPRKFPSTYTNREGKVIERDARALALKGALTVAACATHEFKRGQSYGISGLATVANLRPTTMIEYLRYAEDFGLIGVANRRGRHKALRWVRWSPTDPTSPETRVKRSYGPTKELNAEVVESRKLAREAAAAAAEAEAVFVAEREAMATEWLRSLPEDPAIPHYAYAEPESA